MKKKENRRIKKTKKIEKENQRKGSVRKRERENEVENR